MLRNFMTVVGRNAGTKPDGDYKRACLQLSDKMSFLVATSGCMHKIGANFINPGLWW